MLFGHVWNVNLHHGNIPSWTGGCPSMGSSCARGAKIIEMTDQIIFKMLFERSRGIEDVVDVVIKY